MTRLERTRFVTFDGAVEAYNPLQRPDRYRHLESDLGAAKRIARGAGLSYAAASFGAQSIVQEMSAFDRLLEFDPRSLTLRVEAAATIGAIANWASRRNLSLPVLPGYPTITVGGCIAADVHGKNPLRDGTFGHWVEAMTLYHPAYGLRTVDRDRHREEFHATCGGYGLTGVIVDATLRLVKQGGSAVQVRHVPVASVEAAIEAITSASAAHDFAYSWHDGTQRGARFGEGMLFLGSWTGEAAKGAPGYRSMSAAQRARLPLSLWNPTSARLGNAYFRRSLERRPVQRKTPFDAAFPFAKQVLYHRFYGRAGLAEVQVLVPDAARQTFVRETARVIERTRAPLVMMSVKRFRAQSHALGMSGEGALIALDLMRREETARTLIELDAVCVDLGAQPNVAKDSRVPARVAAATLPGYAPFRSWLAQYDPDRLYVSELSQRLEL